MKPRACGSRLIPRQLRSASGLAAGLVQRSIPERLWCESSARWDDLSAEDQKLHLAGPAEWLASGWPRCACITKMNSGAECCRRRYLRSPARRRLILRAIKFLQTFLAKSPTMVDYLHLEILQRLAHDDDRLLGHNYPGPWFEGLWFEDARFSPTHLVE